MENNINNYCIKMADGRTVCIPLAGKRKRRRRSTVTSCPAICITGTGLSSNPTTPCSGTTQALQEAGELIPYSNQLSGVGGASPYTFIITSPEIGALPPDLTMDVNGLISGTPAALSSGIYTFTVQATDSNGCIGTQVFTLSVSNN